MTAYQVVRDASILQISDFVFFRFRHSEFEIGRKKKKNRKSLKHDCWFERKLAFDNVFCGIDAKSHLNV